MELAEALIRSGQLTAEAMLALRDVEECTPERQEPRRPESMRGSRTFMPATSSALLTRALPR
jgi:hypothetical protein